MNEQKLRNAIKKLFKEALEQENFSGFNLGINNAYVNYMEKNMNKDKNYTNKEFLDLFTQKYALQHSSVMDTVKDALKEKGFKIDENVQEDYGSSPMSNMDEDTDGDGYDIGVSDYTSESEQIDEKFFNAPMDSSEEFSENLRSKLEELRSSGKISEEQLDSAIEYLSVNEYDLFNQYGLDNEEKAIHSILEDIKSLAEGIDEDSLAFRHKAGQREKERKGVALGQHAPHSDAALTDEIFAGSLKKKKPSAEKPKQEGAGIGLAQKHGMNIKPTYNK